MSITIDEVREVIAGLKVLPVAPDSIDPQADLYSLGLTSFGSVQLMLALEDRFNVEFAESMLTRKTFSSLAAIDAALATLVPEA